MLDNLASRILVNVAFGYRLSCLGTAVTRVSWRPDILSGSLTLGINIFIPAYGALRCLEYPLGDMYLEQATRIEARAKARRQDNQDWLYAQCMSA